MHLRDSARLTRAALLGLLLPLSGLGCDEPHRTSSADAGAADAGPPQPILDKELSEAVAAASAAGADPRAPAAGGPPETGVFPTGAADAIQRRDAPAKIEVLDQGTEPRATFAGALDAGAQQKVTVTVGMRMGAQAAMPTLDFSLDLKVDKAKDDKGKKDDAKAAAPTAGSVAVTAKVTAAALDPKQPGQIPKELAEQIAKLKGSAIHFMLAPNGAGSSYTIELAKGADPGLEPPVRALMEAVSILTVPAPTKPVGAGGYWMATDRSTSLGIDVLRYRVFRVEKVEGGAPTLAIECRQYAAEGTASIPMTGDPTQLTVGLYQSQGKGHVSLGDKPTLLASLAQLSQQTGARLSKGAGQGAPQMAVQTEMSADIAPAGK